MGAIPHHYTKCGGGAKNSGGRLYKFKLIKNTFSVYLGIFNSGLLLISGQFLLSCPIKINFKASDKILKKYLKWLFTSKWLLSWHYGFKFSSEVMASQIQSLHHQFIQICWKTPQNTMTS